MNQKRRDEIKRDIVNELHKPRRVNFARLKVKVKGLDETWSCDLSEWVPFSKENSGMKYALMVIDNFSKFAFCEALKDKKACTVSKAFEKIIKKSGRCCKKLQTDRGMREYFEMKNCKKLIILGQEFYGKPFQNLMEKYKIRHYSTYSEVKCAIGKL